MSDMWILHDKKNRRNFCLGNVPRLWGGFLSGHADGDPWDLKDIEEQIPDACAFAPPGPRGIAIRLWAFCQVAAWQVELRWDGIDYEDEWQGSGWEQRLVEHPLVGSLYTGAFDPDPCAAEQLHWEEEARKT